MFSLLVSFLVLIAGYFVYGRVAEKVFSPDGRKTPAIAINDGVDCIPIKPWKAFLIQLLNIAGTGPIFGALMGACFGPVVFLWIVLGSVLGGGVHDYFCGMISSRNRGASVVELSGNYLGRVVKSLMLVFTLLLLVLTGAVFVNSPASLLTILTRKWAFGENFWIIVILVYYLLATLLPIDKIIGRFYPVFGFLLLLMAVCVLGGIVFGPYKIPEITLSGLHPENLPVWPFMFITVACGAVSGFHATQSPVVAKCITSEMHGRRVFYGAMISEAVIALVWAAAGVAFYGSTELLNNALHNFGNSGTVYEISRTALGSFGGVLAIVGVIVCPITSGDTAFRSARLIVAEITHLDQKNIKNRLVITIPLLFLGACLTQIDFDVLWRYFSWANQTLAMMSLWVSTAYLIKEKTCKAVSFITAIPATFMSAVSLTYILMAKEGFRLGRNIAYPAGICFGFVLFCFYLFFMSRSKRGLK